ncbi:hypothetical protein VTN49DRAFT_590 [Thermomyces lanuginosus]|uniref:uncharacterized protein n=1 Tax=Thermomyces lanuginosus TaxID=5541 RepID=UPI003741EA74
MSLTDSKDPSSAPAMQPGADAAGPMSEQQPVYRVYKVRYLGLAQLVLLNIIISWDWLTFSAISTTSAEYFDVSESDVNWLSTAALFAFVAATPIVMYTLHHNVKTVMMIASALVLVGNWMRFAGAKAQGGIFGLLMFGQLLIGFAQPFVLTAPTRYSDLWFTDRGRTSATALATLANPLGAALGQLIDSFWASQPDDIPDMVMWLAVIATVAAAPSFFIPARPPTPASASSDVPKTPLVDSIQTVTRMPQFWIIFFSFSVYVGFFNSVSALINQIMFPYGFSETDAGIAGGVLIVVGLVAAAIMSPINDRFKIYLAMIRTCVPIHAAAHIAFIFAPSSPAGIAPSIVVCALLGASAFSLLPVILELLVEITYPASPEVGSTLCWMGGQLLGGIFTIVQTALKAGPDADPPRNMRRSLIFSAVIAAVAAVPPLTLNVLGPKLVNRRLEADRRHGLSTTSLREDQGEYKI